MSVVATIVKTVNVVVNVNAMNNKDIKKENDLIAEAYQQVNEANLRDPNTPVSYTHLTLPTTPYV